MAAEEPELNAQPVSVFLGNLGLTAEDPKNISTYVVSEQTVAVKEALACAASLRDSGKKVSLFALIDHPFHSKHRTQGPNDETVDSRVLRHRLIDPGKVPSRDRREDIHWPKANILVEPVREVLRGPVARFGFRLSDVRVFPEESLFWMMNRELSGHPDFCAYRPGSGRKLFERREGRGDERDDFLAPRCVSIFGAAMLLATNRNFVPVGGRESQMVRVEPTSVQSDLRFYYQLDGARVTRSAVEEGYNFVTNPDTYGLNPDLIKLSVSAESTKPHFVVVPGAK